MVSVEVSTKQVRLLLPRIASFSSVSQLNLGMQLEVKSMCWLFLKRMLEPIASMVSGGLWVIGENYKDLLINIATPPPSLLGRSFLRMWWDLNLGAKPLFQWVSLSRASSGLTKDR